MPEKKQIDTVIFDMDGTIADSFEVFLDLFNNKISKKVWMKQISKADFTELKNMEPREILKKYVKWWKLPFLIFFYKRYSPAYVCKIKPFAGMPLLIQKLSDNGLKLGLLSTNSKHNIHEFLNLSGLKENFNYVSSASHSIKSKSKALQHFAKKNHIDLSRAIYIGDEIKDVKSCHECGVKVIAVTWGFNEKQHLLEQKPDYLVNSVDELQSLLDELIALK